MTTSVDPVTTFCPDLDDLFCMEDSLGFGDDDDLSCNESLDSSTLSAGSGAAMGTAAPMASLAPYTLPSELRSVASDPVFNAPRVLTNILSRQNLQTAEPTPDYFKTLQTEVRPHMRKIVSDWMLDVCEEQQCHPEVFHLAMNYVDRVLSRVAIGKHQFQLIGCVCMFLASKFKETCPLPSENLVIYTDNSVSVKDITTWELMILNVLGWDLSAVTPYSILDQLLRSLELDNSAETALSMEKVRKHAETLVALAATEYAFCQKSPALVAVASLGAALRGLNTQGLDKMISSLEITTGVKKNAIKDCMNEIEVSIGKSLSGSSFEPQQQQQPQPHRHQEQPQQQKVPTPSQVAAVSAPKTVIYNSAPSSNSSSTTPTDVMDVTAAYVY